MNHIWNNMLWLYTCVYVYLGICYKLADKQHINENAGTNAYSGKNLRLQHVSYFLTEFYQIKD